MLISNIQCFISILFKAMKITLNNEPVIVDESCQTLNDLLELRNIPKNGVAIAVNNKLIARTQWTSKILKPEDDVVVITATFGG